MLRTTIASSSRTPLGARSISTKRRTGKDAALRLAVEMYHVTPSFMAADASSPDLEKRISQSVLTVTDTTTSNLGRTGGLTFRHAAQILDLTSRNDYLPRDDSSLSGRYDKHTHSARSVDASVGVLQLLDPVVSAPMKKGASAKALQQRQPGQNVKQQEHPLELPPIEDKKTTARIVGAIAQNESGVNKRLEFVSYEDGASTSKSKAKLTPGLPLEVQRYTAGGSTRGGVTEYLSLNSRQARVRDVLFGTVAGQLPGLDIIRERERERREALRAERVLAQPPKKNQQSGKNKNSSKARNQGKGKKAAAGKK